MNAKTLLVLLLVLTLAACAAPAQPSPPLPTATARAVVRPSATRPAGCTVVSQDVLSTPDPGAQIPPVTGDDWALGPAEARMTIINYSDFQCPGCALLAPILNRIAGEHPHDVRVVYRHYPLTSVYDKAALSAQAAEAAGRQDRFWGMHDLLFTRQQEWSGLSPTDFQEWLLLRARDLKLDVEKFEQDLTSPEIIAAVQDAYDRSAAVGMPGTPYLLINGAPYEGPTSFVDLDTVVSLILLKDRQYADCPPMAIDAAKQYLAVVQTEKGEITLELFPDKAPLAVNSFIFLARQGWFDGITFHRVLPGFVAQAGDPTGSGYGGPGYAFDNEISDLTFDQPGLVAMANAGPGSNGSQFFITFTAVPRLNGGYTIFGRVVAGMDVAESLTPRDPSKPGELPSGDKILHIEIQEK